MTATITEQDLVARVASADSLPTPPVVLEQINKVVNNPNKSAYDVAAVVSEDPAMTAKILRMVNSAYYGLSDRISSVRRAIAILGFNAVQSLVTCVGVMGTFSGSKEDAPFVEVFWRHSLITASAARVLCSARTDGEELSSHILSTADEAFTAGLLHDIGKMLLVCYLTEERSQVRAHTEFGQRPDCEIEREVLGLDHAGIGGELGRQWKLSVPLVASIQHHHDMKVSDAEHLSLARVIHVADYLAHTVADEATAVSAPPKIIWEEAAILGVHEDNLADVATLVRSEYGRSEIFLQMVTG